MRKPWRDKALKKDDEDDDDNNNKLYLSVM